MKSNFCSWVVMGFSGGHRLNSTPQFSDEGLCEEDKDQSRFSNSGVIGTVVRASEFGDDAVATSVPGGSTAPIAARTGCKQRSGQTVMHSPALKISGDICCRQSESR